MSEKIVKILLLILMAAGIVSYIYYLNPQGVTVALGSGKSFELPLAFVLIFTFGFGALTIAVFLFVFGLKVRFQNWRAQRRAQTRRHQRQLISSAGEQMALGDFASARSILTKVITQDPEDVCARVGLARTFKEEGRLREALAVLDEARANQKKSVELLLFAADLNLALGNNTAAHDNAALVLTLVPGNSFALRRLVQSAAGLRRFNEAIEYQKQLVKSAGGDLLEQEQESLAALELKLIEEQDEQNPVALRKSLETLLKRHRDFIPALESLAALEQKEEKPDEAARILARLFVLSKNAVYLEQLAVMWLKLNNPQKALLGVRAALEQKAAQDLWQGRLVLVDLLLQLEMIDEARKALEEIETTASSKPELQQPWQVLRAALLRKQGRPEEALDLLIEVLDTLKKQQGLSFCSIREKLVLTQSTSSSQADYNLRNEIIPPRIA